MITFKGNGALATTLKQEVKGAWLKRQSPRVQKWAARYEQDKKAQQDELKAIGKEVANAEVKFASKAQRRTQLAQPQARPMARISRIKSKSARRLRLDPMVDGFEIHRYRWNAIKNELWRMRKNTWIPAWYKFYGPFADMRDNRAVARDIAWIKTAVKEMGLRY